MASSSMHFLALPLDTTPSRTESVGTEDEDYFVTARYLESCPVILELPTPRHRRGGGLVKSFRSDGLYLWDDLDHADALAPTTRFKRALVNRALDHSGVADPIDEQTRARLIHAIADALA